MIIIGSQALNQHIPNLRTPKDWDVVGRYDEIVEFIGTFEGTLHFCIPKNFGKKLVARKGDTYIEGDIAWEGSSSEKFLELMEAEGCEKYASLNGLYALKMSHRYLRNSPHFGKTMEDIQTMRELGAEIPMHYMEFMELREKETYYYKHPNLDQNKNNFFETEGVEYTYDHDTIHEAVKVGEKPAYTYFLENGAQVKCSKEKFEKLDYVVQLRAVLEEAYTLALERALIPFNFESTPRKAFSTALMKVCTSITSGWFREFAWEHYDEVWSLYNDDYAEKFKVALTKGEILPYTKAA